MVESHFIVLEPDKELEFARPFTSIVKQTLVVHNQHPTAAIAFKVKTTAPKQYCVRPNAGRIGPNSQCEVQILLQAMKEDPPEDIKCKDKFLVQAIVIPDELLKVEGEEGSNKLAEAWSRAEQLKKSDPDNAENTLLEKKLRCVYVGSSKSTPSVPVSPESNEKKSSLSGKNDTDVELFEAKETIKKLVASIENYKAEINKLGGSGQRKSGGKGNETVIQTKGLGMEILVIVAIISFLMGVFFF